ncbi:MAG: UDP-N-acetylmuramoyl-tripeptide--D-alanyl-D-alanine ligase, partial [Candidatus Eisenbacteria bacterium]|nr:UDP-N-acetylmuramoyl-tripeptide--D-alanyl-D-alanine ligase [Candidatus Eisenbacteria bacterium]
VEDTVVALQDMARAHRNRMGTYVISITGSNGKTTVKEMLATALGLEQTWKTAANLNNHLGVPLTLLGLEPDHQFAVVEMGMNHSGEIDLLTRTALPNIALITNISEAHLKGVGSRLGVAQAKAEITAGLSEGGVLITPHGDPDLEQALSGFAGKRITFGESSEADWKAESVTWLSTGMQVTVRGQVYQIPAFGEHMVSNLLATLACVEAAGGSLQGAAQNLTQFTPVPGRLELRAAGEVVLLDDTYNANPASMRAALQVLNRLETPGGRWAVLGDMLELGDNANELHVALANHLSGLDGLITVGPFSRQIGQHAEEIGSLPAEYRHVADATEAAATLLGLLKPGDTVLFKGSRGIALDRAREIVEEAMRGKA